MKKNFRTAIMVIAIVLSLVVGVAAANVDGGQPEVRASLLSSLRVWNQGKEITLKSESGAKLSPLYYNGEVYLPISALGKALDFSVSWNQEIDVLNIGGVPANMGLVLNHEDGLGLNYILAHEGELGVEYTIKTNNFTEQQEKIRHLTEAPILSIANARVNGKEETQFSGFFFNSAYDEDLTVLVGGVQQSIELMVFNFDMEPITVTFSDCDTGKTVGEPIYVEGNNGSYSATLSVVGINRLKITKEIAQAEDGQGER